MVCPLFFAYPLLQLLLLEQNFCQVSGRHVSISALSSGKTKEHEDFILFRLPGKFVFNIRPPKPMRIKPPTSSEASEFDGSICGIPLKFPQIHLNSFNRVRKRGLFRKSHFLEILENFEILEILENPQTVESKGEPDHFLVILENPENLEILEISRVKRPLS